MPEVNFFNASAALKEMELAWKDYGDPDLPPHRDHLAFLADLKEFISRSGLTPEEIEYYTLLVDMYVLNSKLLKAQTNMWRALNKGQVK